MKNQKSTAKRTARKVRTLSPAPVTPPAQSVLVERSPSHVSFFRLGEGEAFSRLHNGPEGSDAAEKVRAAIAEFKAAGLTVEERTP